MSKEFSEENDSSNMTWLFGSRKQGRLQPTWRYSTRGVIWRLIPTESRKLVGEERDLSSKSVSFFCLNQMTGKVLWEMVKFDEAWWIGVEAIRRDIIFLHKFTKPDLPEHRGIIAVDVFTGKQLWSNDQLKFRYALDKTLFAVRESIEERLLFELDSQTGEILRSWENDEQPLREARIRETPQFNHEPELPFPVLDLTTDDSDAAVAIRKHCHTEDLVGSVEAIDLDDVTIFNYHERNPRSTSDETRMYNFLKVVNKETGKMIFEEMINSDSSGIVPESFFVHHDMLFFVKDRKTLTAVRVATPGDE
ncbi:MAG: DUF4905 domain-containing protein [Ignavibacteriae bacterium]|nr:DUF4905 domain-containing protein [Ignavibacteriota bacterium]